MKSMIPTLEQVSGNKFDIDRLREVVGLSLQCTKLWRRVLECGAAKPAPLTFFDATIHMAPAVILRGKPEAIEYYKLLIENLKIESRIKRERSRKSVIDYIGTVCLSGVSSGN